MLCFEFCSSLTSIDIPSSVTSIGGGCFQECYKLGYINCYAINPPLSEGLGQPGNTILYVPASSIEKYKKADGWKDFIAILPIPGTEGELKGKCEKPSITFANGKLLFESSTSGANYHYTVSSKDMATDAYSENGEVNLKAAYNISAYATAEGYSPSDKSTATLYWLDGRIDDPTGITPAAAKRGIVVSTQEGEVTLSGLDDGEAITFYSVNGSNLGTVISRHGAAKSSFLKGQMIIAKIGKDSMKIAL